MSSRRLARAKRSPSFERPADQNPNRVYQRVIQHPVYGKVRIFIKGGEVYRLRTEHPISAHDDENSFSRFWYPEKFRQVLEMLGISE